MNIFLYVLDSLRADHVSCYGYDRETTPNIDALAVDGYRFKNAYSASTWTKEAAVSLLTGLYSPAVATTTVYDSLPDEVTTLAELLGRHGFRTAAASATGHISPAYGFDAGFDRFDAISDRGDEDKAALQEDFGANTIGAHNFVPPTATELQDRVLEEQRSHDGEEFFGMIWSLDTHDPFYVTDDTAEFSDSGRFIGSISDGQLDELVNTYDDMIRLNDRRFGKFVRTLKRRGEYEKSLIFVVGDHGEAFEEHGTRGHAGVPYAEQIAVPFVVKPPATDARSYDTDRAVQLTDVFPTVLGQLDASVPDYLQGECLGSGKRIDRDPPRVVYTATQYDYSRNRLESIQCGNDKLIRSTPTQWDDFFQILYQMVTNTRLQERLSNMDHSYDLVKTIKSQIAYRLTRPALKEKLYDLNTDPGEMRDLSGSSASQETLSELSELLVDVRSDNETHSQNVGEQALTQIDPDTKKQLEDIGYKI